MVDSLGLAGPGLSGGDVPEDLIKRFNEIIAQARDQGPQQAVELWLKDPFMAPAMGHSQLAPRIRQLCLDNSARWLNNSQLNRPITPPAAHRLDEIHAPVLALLGDLDVSIIHTNVDLLVKQARQVKKVLIPGAGHIVNMEKPIEFNREAIAF